MSECVVKILSIDDNTDQVFWSKVIQVSTGEDEPQAIVETEFVRPGKTVPVFRRTRRSKEDGNEVIALDRGIPQPCKRSKKKKRSFYLCDHCHIPRIWTYV